MNLNQIFSGSVGLNGWGIAGLVVMLAGAAVSLTARRISEKRENLIRIVGLIVCGFGAALVIGLGK